ncbi:hypothetical protein ALC62_14162 [Cyphomyrmex costatus]|uniref:Uncharacterized protein n=1 Tax=Cyphomyrmex costatus TaxID=456900 RepID=A0A195C4Z8_9HYME|nr:hypothetical protein ALC62_14162 [Cyphomyrmex costatus]
MKYHVDDERRSHVTRRRPTPTLRRGVPTKRCKVEENYKMFPFFFKCVFITTIHKSVLKRTTRVQHNFPSSPVVNARSDKVLAEGSSRECPILNNALRFFKNYVIGHSYVCCGKFHLSTFAHIYGTLRSLFYQLRSQFARERVKKKKLAHILPWSAIPGYAYPMLIALSSLLGFPEICPASFSRLWKVIRYPSSRLRRADDRRLVASALRNARATIMR